MDIAGYHRAIDRMMRDLNITGPMPFEFANVAPFNVLEEITLTDETGPDGYALFLAQKYGGANFTQAQELRRGMYIVERDVRGKKSRTFVKDVTRIGRYGHGHIVVNGNWRYEPETVLETE